MPEYVPPEAEDAYVVYEGADVPAPDLDAPLIEHRYERTTPKVTGAPWDMAAWIRADRERREAEGTFEAGGDIEIIATAWIVEADEMPRAPRAFAKRLIAGGWAHGLTCSIVYVTPTLYVAATESHSRGDVRYLGHDDTSWSVRGRLDGPGGTVAKVWGTWVTREEVGRKTGTTFRDALTWDPVLGIEYVDKAGELGEWLSIFCP